MIGRKCPGMGKILEDAMEGQIVKNLEKGEKSGGGKAYPFALAAQLKVVSYEKIMLAKMLFFIFLGLITLLFVGAQQ